MARKKKELDNLERVVKLATEKHISYGQAMAYIHRTSGDIYHHFGLPIPAAPEKVELPNQYAQTDEGYEKSLRYHNDHPCKVCGTIIPAGTTNATCSKECAAMLRKIHRYRLEKTGVQVAGGKLHIR